MSSPWSFGSAAPTAGSCPCVPRGARHGATPPAMYHQWTKHAGTGPFLTHEPAGGPCPASPHLPFLSLLTPAMGPCPHTPALSRPVSLPTATLRPIQQLIYRLLLLAFMMYSPVPILQLSRDSCPSQLRRLSLHPCRTDLQWICTLSLPLLAPPWL